jgi:hypothetical protein
VGKIPCHHSRIYVARKRQEEKPTEKQKDWEKQQKGGGGEKGGEKRAQNEHKEAHEQKQTQVQGQKQGQQNIEKESEHSEPRVHTTRQADPQTTNRSSRFSSKCTNSGWRRAGKKKSTGTPPVHLLNP